MTSCASADTCVGDSANLHARHQTQQGISDRNEFNGVDEGVGTDVHPRDKLSRVVADLENFEVWNELQEQHVDVGGEP